MTSKQQREACSLIRSICSNYDRVTGGCVLLEDRDSKKLKAQIMGDDFLKTCVVCGRPFRALSNRAKYCAGCAERQRLNRQREYMRNRG